MNELRIRRLVLDALHDAVDRSDRSTALDYESLIDAIECGEVVISRLVPDTETPL